MGSDWHSVTLAVSTIDYGLTGSGWEVLVWSNGKPSSSAGGFPIGEVGRLAVTLHEVVGTGTRLLWGAIGGERPIFHPPPLGLALPARQLLAVEHRLESSLRLGGRTGWRSQPSGERQAPRREATRRGSARADCETPSRSFQWSPATGAGHHRSALALEAAFMGGRRHTRCSSPST